MCQESVRLDVENRTYRLDISTGDYNGVFWGTLKYPIWRQIPCDPSDAVILVVTVHIEYEDLNYDGEISETLAKQYSLLIVRQFCLAMENIHARGPFLMHRSPMILRAGFQTLEIDYVYHPQTIGAAAHGTGPRPTAPLTQLDRRWRLIIERIQNRLIRDGVVPQSFLSLSTMTINGEFKEVSIDGYCGPYESNEYW